MASQTKGVSVMSAADTGRSIIPEPHGGSTAGAYDGWCIINNTRCVGSHSVERAKGHVPGNTLCREQRKMLTLWKMPGDRDGEDGSLSAV